MLDMWGAFGFPKLRRGSKLGVCLYSSHIKDKKIEKKFGNLVKKVHIRAMNLQQHSYRQSSLPLMASGGNTMLIS